MTLSCRYAEASAATMESAHTGQVGKSQPRGSGLDATVDRTSATADIRDLLCDLKRTLNSRPKYRLICLTMSQHKCVGFRFSFLQCSECVSPAFRTCASAHAPPK